MQAEVLISTTEMDHQDWLDQRRKGIGGSDAASIAGVNRWKSPIGVYLEKIGEAPESKPLNEEATYWGNVHEETVAKEFSKRTGLKVRRRNAILKHPDYDWILGNVDRMIVGKKEGLECKTASEYLKTEWEGEEIPISYLLQCQHYMAVTGYQAWWIAVLIGGNKFVYKRIERDEELIESLIGIEKDFWENHVLKKVPPMMDGSQASEDLIKALYPESEPDSEIELPSESKAMIQQFEEAKQAEKEAAERKKEAENRLKNLLGTYEKGFADNHVITWKQHVRNNFDSKTFKKEHPDLYKKYAKTTQQRRFSIKEAN